MRPAEVQNCEFEPPQTCNKTEAWHRKMTMFQNRHLPNNAWFEHQEQTRADIAVERSSKILVSSTYTVPAFRNAGRQRRCHHSSTQDTEKQQSPTNSGASACTSSLYDPQTIFHATTVTIENGQSWQSWRGARPAISIGILHVGNMAARCKVNVAEQRRRQAALAEYARKVWNVETNIACKMPHC